MDKELEDLLKAATEQIEKIEEDPIQIFLKRYNITPGEEKVTTTFLYKLFLLENTNYNRRLFFSKMEHYLGTARNVFYINKSVLTIDLENTPAKPKKKIGAGYKPHVQKFLDEYNITQGSLYVEGYVIFGLYLNYVKKHRITRKVSKLTFSVNMGIIFTEKKIIKSETFYSVNESIKQHNDAISIIRESHNNAKKNKKAKK